MDVTKEVSNRLKEREKLGKTIEASIATLAAQIQDLVQHDLKTYHLLNKPDVLFDDSPLSIHKTYQAVKEYMAKKDMDFIGYPVWDGKIALKNFSDFIKSGAGWVLRFAKPLEKEKTGLEAIL